MSSSAPSWAARPRVAGLGARSFGVQPLTQGQPVALLQSHLLQELVILPCGWPFETLVGDPTAVSLSDLGARSLLCAPFVDSGPGDSLVNSGRLRCGLVDAGAGEPHVRSRPRRSTSASGSPPPGSLGSDRACGGICGGRLEDAEAAARFSRLLGGWRVANVGSSFIVLFQLVTYITQAVPRTLRGRSYSC